MLKLIVHGSYSFQEPSTQLVKLASRGLRGDDLNTFIKRAGHYLADKLKDLDVRPGEVPVHLLGLGATEFTGPNRNGDGFKGRTLEKCAETFMTHARPYRNHDNKPHSNSYGRIIWAGYNPEMKRAELIVGYNGDEKAAAANKGYVADKELEKLARDEDLPVSMACLTDPKYPILTRDRGYVGIADVKVGDFVWTHRGRWRRVTQLNRRRYTGELFTFKMNGLPVPLELTADHPMFAKVFAGSREIDAMKSKARRYFTDPAAFESEIADWTHASHVGVGDRFFYKPVGRYENYGRIADRNLATIMGYYLAEGSFGYNSSGRAAMTEFNCCMSDSLPRRLPALIGQMYPDVTVDICPRQNSDVGLSVQVFSTEFSEFLRTYVGRGCKNKQIAPEIFNAEDDIKLAFLGAWLDGDGWPDKKGIHWSSASLGLILQGRDLLATLGIPASIYRIVHPADRPKAFGKDDTVEYTLNVAHLDAWRLSEHSEKVANYVSPSAGSRTKPAAMRYCPDGTYAIRVKDVSSRYATDVETYNFEVEEDESYSAAGLISHNCRIPYDVCSFCSNRAPTRKHYCDEYSCSGFGCKEGLTKVAEDGRMQYVDNPDPTFFDISYVVRPADRIAYANGILTKAASCGHVLGGAELAELAGLSAPVSAFGTTKLAVQQSILQDLACSEAVVGHDLADNVWNLAFSPGVRGSLQPIDLSTPSRVKQALHALALEQIVLPVNAWLELLVGQSKAAEAVDDVRGQLPGIYSRLIDKGELVSNPYTFDDSSYPPGLTQFWAKRAAADYSLNQTLAFRRLQRAPFCAVETVELIQGADEAEKRAAEHKGAEKLATHYAMYTVAALERIQNIAEDFPLISTFVVRQNAVR